MPSSRLSSKGQVVIPLDVREKLRLKAGDKIEFTLHDGHAHLQKKGDDALEAFLGGPKVHWKKGELERTLAEQYD